MSSTSVFGVDFDKIPLFLGLRASACALMKALNWILFNFLFVLLCFGIQARQTYAAYQYYRSIAVTLPGNPSTRNQGFPRTFYHVVDEELNPLFPSTSSFSASPAIEAAAGTSTLAGEVTNASSVAIAPGSF